MSLVDVVAAMMFLGVLFYALFAGADFGSGIWDLLAGEGEHAPALLAADARRAGDNELAAWIGRRALACGAVTGVVALAAVVPLDADAERLADRLEGRAAPLVVVSALAGLVSLGLLRRQRWSTARVAAVVAVSAIVVGWGVAQYPYLLTDELTL